MKVLILSTNIINGYSSFNDLIERENQYALLVCNSNRKNRKKFIFLQLYFFLFRFSLLKKIGFLKLFYSGKAKITPHQIHSLKTIKWVFNNEFDLGIHGINVIYKEKLLNCFSIGILNAHLGLLPEFRGKSVVAWSLFENRSTGISTFIIDKGIDTGEHIVFSEEVNVDHCESAEEAKNFLASKSNSMYKKAINKIGTEGFKYAENDTSKGRRYYSMSKLFTSCVDTLIQK